MTPREYPERYMTLQLSRRRMSVSGIMRACTMVDFNYELSLQEYQLPSY
jgi:hypothetical protein